MDKDPSRIPKGIYCYGLDGICPYWSLKKDLPQQENGYCSFLEESDYERNERIGKVRWVSGDGKDTFTDPHEIPLSLIWDGTKECGINEEDDDL